MRILKTKIIVAFLFISFNSLCQENKFALGVFSTIDYSYRYLIDYSKIGRDITTNRDFHETPKFIFSSGMDFTYSLNSKNQLYIGTIYSQKGQIANYTNTFALAGVVYYNIFTPDIKNSVTRQLYYLEIPIRYNLFFSDTDKKTRTFVTLGASTNILLRESISYKSNYYNLNAKSNFVVKANDYKRLNAQAQFGFGMKIKNNLSILTLLKASIFTSNNSSFYNEYLYSASLGVNYTLRKF